MDEATPRPRFIRRKELPAAVARAFFAAPGGEHMTPAQALRWRMVRLPLADQRLVIRLVLVLGER